MKPFWLSVLLLLCSALPALALSLLSTYPAANTENFLPSDTLRLTFDESPEGRDVSVTLSGRFAAYPIARTTVIGNDLLVFPNRFWLAGDRISVNIEGEFILHSLQFSIRSAGGAIPDPTAQPYRLHYNRLPRAFAAGDFDVDGAIDLAILYTDTLAVARHTGVPPFYRMDALSWHDGGHAACDAARVLRAADLNRDGRPDLVTTDPVRNSLNIYPNLSQPGMVDFAAPLTLPLQLNGPADLQIADIDFNGYPELVVIGTSYEPDFDRLYIYFGSGDFEFTSQGAQLIGLDPSDLEIGDLDIDGDLDMLVGCRGTSSVQLLRNFGYSTPLFQISTPISGLPAGPDGLLLDNLNGCWDQPDGAQYPDLLIWSRGVHALRGRGHLDEESFLLRYRNNAGADFVDPNAVPAPTFVLHAQAADLDEEQSTPDHNLFVIGQTDGGDTVVWVYNDELTIWRQLDSVRSPRSSMAFDVDLDGDLDPFFIDYGSGDVGDESIAYYIDGDSSNIVCWLNFPVTPIDGSRDSMVCYYRNARVYPIEVTTIVPPTSSQFQVLSHPPFPLTLAPGDSFPVEYEFQPVDSGEIGPAACWISYHTATVVGSDRVWLQGTGGRSVLQTHPAHPTGVDTVTLDLGMVEPGGSENIQVRPANHGNYPLNLAYDRNRMFHFQLTALPDSVPPYSIGLEPWTFTFNAPVGSTDSTYTEYLTVYDSTFFHADEFGPLNPTIPDTLTFRLRVHVLVNQLPRFVFSDQTLTEGEAGVFSISVVDPNSEPPLDTVRVLYDGIRPVGASLQTTPPAFQPVYKRSPFSLPFQVDGDVLAPAEVCSLRFRAWDAQFSDRLMDTVWVVPILPLDDPPTIQLAQDTIWIAEGDSLINMQLATASDEEGDSLIFDPQWLSPRIPVVSFQRPRNALAITWRTTFDDGGIYPLRIRAYEQATPAQYAQDTVVFVVEERAPDLAVVAVVPTATTVPRNGPLSIVYEVRELRGAPVEDPFVVTLTRVSGSGTRDTLVSETYSRLDPHGVRSSTYHNDRIAVCGHAEYRVTVTPRGPDLDPANNQREAAVTVRCPDLAVEVSAQPTAIHKYESLQIHAAIRELNGAAFDEPFAATLSVRNQLGTFELASFDYQTLAGNGAITQQVTWQSDTCNDHQLIWQVFPTPGLDANPENNRTVRVIPVECDPFQVWPLPFTPNGDGYNDTLYFDFGDDRYSSPDVELFALDGRSLIKLHDVTLGAIVWNGRDRNDRNCDPGAYLYVFSNNRKAVKSGLVYVVR